MIKYRYTIEYTEDFNEVIVNLIKSNKSFTTFEDIFAEEDEEDSTCEIETLEYIKILLLWAKENFQYKNQRGVILKEEGQVALEWLNEKYIEVLVLGQKIERINNLKLIE